MRTYISPSSCSSGVVAICVSNTCAPAAVWILTVVRAKLAGWPAAAVSSTKSSAAASGAPPKRGGSGRLISMMQISGLKLYAGGKIKSIDVHAFAAVESRGRIDAKSARRDPVIRGGLIAARQRALSQRIYGALAIAERGIQFIGVFHQQRDVGRPFGLAVLAGPCGNTEHHAQPAPGTVQRPGQADAHTAPVRPRAAVALQFARLPAKIRVDRAAQLRPQEVASVRQAFAAAGHDR